MVTALATSDPSGKIVLFGNDYLILALILSVLLRVGVMLIKWQERCVPSIIFSSALGLPALVAGSFNMSASLHTIDKVQWENEKLNTAIQQEVKIDGYATEPLMFIEPDKISMRRTPPSRLTFSIIGTAHAQGAGEILGQKKLQNFDPAQVLREPQYLIILKKADNVQDAKKAWEKIKSVVPHSLIVKGSKNYYVI
jgi:hypothetical protein